MKNDLGLGSMSTEERLVTCVLAALGDPRLNVLCIRKERGGELKSALEAIASSEDDVTFIYYPNLNEEQFRASGVQSLVRKIRQSDGREIRSEIDYLFQKAKENGIVRRNMPRSGFVQYLRALPDADLRKIAEGGFLPQIFSRKR